MTALCIRSLLLGKGSGPAIDRGLAYLGNLQQSDGIWPAVPIRRMPADPATSAFILSQLGEQPLFRDAARVEDAFNWFARHRASLDSQTAQTWDRLRVRLQPRLKTVASLSFR